MSQYNDARTDVENALKENGIKVTVTRNVMSENVATGKDEVKSSSSYDAWGIFKNINSISGDKNSALLGKFKATDRVFLTVSDMQKRDKFTVMNVKYDVVAVIPLAPTDIVIANRAIVREL